VEFTASSLAQQLYLENYTSYNPNNVDGDNSFAIGSYQTTEGDYAAAIGGAQNGAFGDYSISLGGILNNANDEYSIAVGGIGNESHGYLSTTLGGIDNTTGATTSAVISGDNCHVYGRSSITLGGRDLHAFSTAEVVIGQYNSFYTASNNNLFVTEDRLFVIGNGTSSGGVFRSDAFTVLKNSQVGINISNFEANNPNGAILNLNGDLEIQGGIFDSNGDKGTLNQILSTNASGDVEWVNTSEVQFMAGGGGTTRNINVNKETHYLYITSIDNGDEIRIPDAVDVTPSTTIYIIDQDGNAGATSSVIIEPLNGNMNGANGTNLQEPYQVIKLINNGINWFIAFGGTAN